MRGHQPIIDMRMAGFKPRSVNLMLFPAQRWVTEWHASPYTFRDATVVLDDQDMRKVQRLDLRFLVGLQPVIVNGPDNELTKAVAQRCVDAGAKFVLAAYFDFSKPELDQLVRLTSFSKETQHA